MSECEHNGSHCSHGCRDAQVTESVRVLSAAWQWINKKLFLFFDFFSLLTQNWKNTRSKSVRDKSLMYFQFHMVVCAIVACLFTMFLIAFIDHRPPHREKKYNKGINFPASLSQ